MATFDISVDSTLTLAQVCTPYNSEYLDAYGTLSEANNYFDNRLRSVAWKRARKEDKKSAMKEATQMIDCLNFAGIKAVLTQAHQFPRGPSPRHWVDSNCPVRDPDTEVPTDIKNACFEIAMKLIQGYDPDREADILVANSQTFNNVRTGYDRTFVPDYMRAGIPSFRAWSYLQPYLRNPEEIDLVRV